MMRQDFDLLIPDFYAHFGRRCPDGAVLTGIFEELRAMTLEQLAAALSYLRANLEELRPGMNVVALVKKALSETQRQSGSGKVDSIGTPTDEQKRAYHDAARRWGPKIREALRGANDPPLQGNA